MKIWKSLSICLAVILCTVLFITPKVNAGKTGIFTYAVSNGEATITACDGSVSGNITIPSALGGYPVTAIGETAFRDCDDLTGVIVADTVKRIGCGAFDGCSRLESVTFGSGVTTIESYAFSGCYSMTTLELGENVRSIGDYAFRLCENLRTVFIPAALTTLGDAVFSYCSRLNEFRVDDRNDSFMADSRGVLYNKAQTVLQAAPGAISGSYTISATVTQIAHSAFYECDALTAVTFSEGLRKIGNSAFLGCENIPVLVLPESLETIDPSAFKQCTALMSVNIPGQVTEIGERAFSGCMSLQSIAVPESVKKLGDYAFSECYSLNSASVTTKTAIGKYVFQNCTSLYAFEVPRWSTINEGTFYGCSRLYELRIPDSVKTVADYAFHACNYMRVFFTGVQDQWNSITVGRYNTALHNAEVTYGNHVHTFVNYTPNHDATYIQDGTKTAQCETCDALDTIPDAGTRLPSLATGSCGKNIQWWLPENGILTISGTGVIPDYEGGEAPWYAYRAQIRKAVVEEGITALGKNAFYNMYAMTEVELPETLTAIGEDAFLFCSDLTGISIPNGVKTVGAGAFFACENLRWVHIPESVTDIGADAFFRCYALENFTVDSSNQYYTSDAQGVLYTKDRTTLIAAPGALTGYYWVAGEVSTLMSGAFYGCRTLTAIVIPTSVNYIGSNMFYSNLKDVYYFGSRDQWEMIYFESYWDLMDGKTFHYDWDGHMFINYVSDGNATCTTTGTKTAKCEFCDETDTIVDTDAVPGHSFTFYVSNKDATCVADGTKTAKCDNCDATDTTAEEGTALEHLWDEGLYIPPTLKNEGYTLYTCLQCGETKKEIDTLPSEILSQPKAVTTETGTQVQFRVETLGRVVSYRWQYRKIYKWFDTTMDGYDTDTLTVSAAGSRNGYDYRCVITFADGTVLCTEPAKLTVNTNITDIINPNDQTVVLGYKGQFTAGAKGESLKYQWEYRRTNGERWIETAMEGATKMTVYIESTTARDGYQYRCRITDVTGKIVYTEPATMRVLSFESHPVETFAANGTNVVFTVTTSVESGFTYQWQYRRSATGNWTNTTMSGYNTATLTVGATLARNGYEYRCVLTGSKNSKIESKSAVLHVGEPLVLEDQSVSCTVPAGKTILFSVVASHVYTYQWEYARAGSDIWYTTTMEGATTASLKVQATAERNGYRYRCVIKGLDGTQIISQPITLTVK